MLLLEDLGFLRYFLNAYSPVFNFKTVIMNFIGYVEPVSGIDN